MKKPINRVILDYLFENGIKKTALSDMLGESPSNTANKLAKSDLSTDYVLRISEALKHNFFRDLANQFDDKEAKPDESKDSMLQVMMEIVQQNNRILEANGMLDYKSRKAKSATKTQNK